MIVVTHPHDGTVREDEVRAHDGIGSGPQLPDQPTDTAAKRITDNPDPEGLTRRIHQPVLLRCGEEILGPDTR